MHLTTRHAAALAWTFYAYHLESGARTGKGHRAHKVAVHQHVPQTLCVLASHLPERYTPGRVHKAGIDGEGTGDPQVPRHLLIIICTDFLKDRLHCAMRGDAFICVCMEHTKPDMQHVDSTTHPKAINFLFFCSLQRHANGAT
jgi:hypothetical protein